MARLLYPHDSLSDEVYADVLKDALTYVADGAGFTQTLTVAERPRSGCR